MSEAPSPDHLLLNEVFGPTFQGEGPSAGQLASFVRLGLCNLACPWCDSAQTWDFVGRNGVPHDRREELAWWSPAEVDERLRSHGTSTVVITGGEPMLAQDRLGALIRMLHGRGVRIEVETNGTIEPTPWMFDHVHRFNVSPKLGGNTGMKLATRIRPAALRKLAYHPRASFKFVVAGEADVREVEQLALEYGLNASQVWLMPLATTREDLDAALPAVAELALVYGMNLSNRLQVQVWSDRRGV